MSSITRIKQEKIEALTKKLEEGIKEVFTSQKYKDYLSTMAKFHRYSFGNCLLIAMQKPEASLVAGYRSWEKMERKVKPGEKGIQIFGGSERTKIKDVPMLDPETMLPKLDDKGMLITEQKQFTYTQFFPVYVFDVSQTEGKPLPTLTNELQGTVMNYAKLMRALQAVTAAPIRFEAWDEAKKGYYNFVEQEIVIKAGMSELQTIKTAVHEVSHSLLHSDKEHQKGRATMEVEAESIAYVICQHLGLDTSDYSFGYLAGWSENKELPELKDSLKVIQETAHEVIEKLDKTLFKNITVADIYEERQEETISNIVDTYDREAKELKEQRAAERVTGSERKWSFRKAEPSSEYKRYRRR